MRLSEIARLPSFALLGRCFSRAEAVLVSPLRETARDPSIFFVPYESRAAMEPCFAGEITRERLELDVHPASLTPVLASGDHGRNVAAIREAIAAGDVYQVNLTLRARLPPISGAELFATFCRRTMPAFAAWLRLPDGTEVVSASPELFFEIHGRAIHSQPMKGTAARNQAGFLARSEKDAAELAMITDLVRNDLTPVCIPRSVRVEHERRLIELPYAVQTVSDVAGTLLPEVQVSEVIDALHPGGSITGAPKQAARRMIAALEPTPRGAYCGTLGFVDGEDAVFSLLIRAAQKDADGWSYGVGGGIVWDSEAAAELEEIHVKLGALR